MLLSKKHGLNPTIPKCFFCGEDKNEIILAGKLKGDIEAPKNVAWDKNPCEKCQEHMKQGVIMISVQEGEEGEDNPYRTGGWCVVKDKALENFISPPELLNAILKKRICFVPDDAWNKLGLPKGEKK